MGIRPYLAMTDREIGNFEKIPQGAALLMGLFSPYGDGLIGLPGSLPPGCPLILTDRVSIQGHDKSRVAGALEQLSPAAVVLDLQQPGRPEAAEMAAYLSGALPCPVVVSAEYARELSGPVLLPPCPCHVPLERYLGDWKGRSLWLELAPGPETLTVTAQGCSVWEEGADSPCPHRDPRLCCHYGIEVSKDRALFRLIRTGEDLRELHRKALALGVTTIGLWQEIGCHWA